MSDPTAIDRWERAYNELAESSRAELEQARQDMGNMRQRHEHDRAYWKSEADAHLARIAELEALVQAFRRGEQK